MPVLAPMVLERWGRAAVAGLASTFRAAFALNGGMGIHELGGRLHIAVAVVVVGCHGWMQSYVQWYYGLLINNSNATNGNGIEALQRKAIGLPFKP